MYTDLDNDRQIDPAEPNYCVFAIKPDAEPAADRSLVSTAMAMVNGDPTFRAYDGLTAAGIGLGSTPAQVHDAYGQPGAWGDMDSYPAMGLLFSYNSENQVGLLAVYAPLPETSSQLRIVPGTSVGRISVGQTYAAVVAARGVPNQFSSFSTSQNAYCIAMWNYQGISATFVDADGDQHPDDTETCYLVFADEPYPGATAEGITQGSTRSAVRAAYGDPDSVSGDYEYYNGLGVAFQYTTNGTVTTIVVFQAARAAGAGLEAHLQAATAALGAR